MPEAPDYPFDTLGFGETLEVAPGIHWVRMPLPFALDHINLWLLADGDAWTVVDTGFNSGTTRTHWEHVFGRLLDGRPITRLIVTHLHPDHIGLAGWFAERWDLTLWMSYAEWVQAHLNRTDTVTTDIDGRLAFMRAHGLDESHERAYRAKRPSFSRLLTPVPQQVNRISDGDRLSIDGAGWRAFTVSGHSPEHVCLWSPERHVLISGDQVLPRITTNISVPHTEPDSDPLGQYLDSFAKFRELPADILVLPSHDRPFHGLHPRLDALAAHHDERFDVIYDALDEPRTAVDLLPILFRRELDPLQLGFAIGESLSHLSYMARRGRAERIIGDDGLIRYRRLGGSTG